MNKVVIVLCIIFYHTYANNQPPVKEPERSTFKELAALWIFVIGVCFIISSVLSGLNIGLMALDPSELQLLKNAGTAKEKKYAAKILPVRRHGNYLLCSILIVITLCNAIGTVLLGEFVAEWLAIFLTTVVIVFFCEILPQSICAHCPLVIGYYTIYLTKAAMVLTAPISYPLGKLLSWMLGKEIVVVYTKERLKELLKRTDLPTNEERIIHGTLEMSQTSVNDVMTLLEDIFMLPINRSLNFETAKYIHDMGYSRIPIYDGEKSNIVNVILSKNLIYKILLDPDDKFPLKSFVEESGMACSHIPSGTRLDVVFRHFMKGREHMAFVVKDEVAQSTSKSDKKRSVIGLVTFEDVIEEIFQQEINDETDRYYDNRSKRKLSTQSNNLFTTLTTTFTRTPAPSNNFKLTTFHFLTEIDAFSSRTVSPKVLSTLLNMDIYFSAKGQGQPEDNIYIHGIPADYFVMLLQGEMEVRVGSENWKFEVKPFKYFGVEALKKGLTEGDFSLQAVMKSLYLKINKIMYDAAVLATEAERSQKTPSIDIKSELYRYFRMIVGSQNYGVPTRGSAASLPK